MLIEELVISHLSSRLSVPVYAEVPADAGMRQSFVVVEKTGSGETNHIRDATLAVQSYGVTLRNAAALSHEVCEAMEALPERDEVSRCRLESEYNWTDADTKRYRYQAVFHLTHF